MGGFRGGFGGGFGGGGNQMQQLMQQAKKMQEEMTKAKEELDNAEIEGTAGGGAVKVTMNGGKILSSVSIDKSVVDPEDVEMLEDLIVAAFNDAYSKADKMTQDKMGGYNLPKGLF